jgi:hypothetical protein
MRSVRVLFVLAAAWLPACGQTPEHLGVLRNDIGLRRIDAGPSPADLSAAQFTTETSLVRKVRGDLVSDDAPETIVALPNGGGVEIQDGSGRTIRRIATDEYLTYFDVVPIRDRKGYLVLYTYPDADGAGTFQVVTAENTSVARWVEKPAPASFDSAVWDGQTALFYLHGDEVVIRSPHGALLARLACPGAAPFSQIYVANAANGRVVVVGSGSGYTPYHMVCVYAGPRLVYQEVEPEHAFGIEAAAAYAGFTVLTRSRKWRYEGG